MPAASQKKLTGKCVRGPGCLTSNGYTKVTVGKYKQDYAHRVAWINKYGPIPDDLHIDHLCRNRSCVNVDHMDLVTPQENWRRGKSITVGNANKVRCKHGHLLSGPNVYLRSGTHRMCKKCSRNSCTKRYKLYRASFQIVTVIFNEIERLDLGGKP